MTRTICIYHANCADGFTAAWAVRAAIRGGVEFFPGTYGEAPPNVIDADVILVDFSYKRKVLETMAKTANSILILDHHKTAQADLDGLWSIPFGSSPQEEWSRRRMGDKTAGPITGIFDMDRSGAQLAWDFFHDAPRPPLVDYVADRDLWRFQLRHSRKIAAWLFSFEYKFDTWTTCSRLLADPDGYRLAVEKGAAIEQKHHKDVRELLKAAKRKMRIGGHVVPVANLPYTMSSDAAGQMAEDAPFAACYFDRADARVFSLRSRGDGMDVSEIAASYGGGGHKNAAGFQMPIGWEGDK